MINLKRFENKIFVNIYTNGQSYNLLASCQKGRFEDHYIPAAETGKLG